MRCVHSNTLEEAVTPIPALNRDRSARIALLTRLPTIRAAGRARTPTMSTWSTQESQCSHRSSYFTPDLGSELKPTLEAIESPQIPETIILKVLDQSLHEQPKVHAHAEHCVWFILGTQKIA